MITPGNTSPEVCFNDYEVHDWTFDRERNEIWRGAIRQTIQPKLKQAVLDTRAGGGVLSMLAAKAGARKVYSIEPNKMYGEKILPGAIQRNDLTDKIEVLRTAMAGLPEPVDVILAANLSNTGMIGLSPVDEVRRLSQYLKPGGIILPGSVTHSIELMTAPTGLYGLDFGRMPRWHGQPNDTALTTAALYHTTNYHNLEPSARVEAEVQVVGLPTVAAHGLANFVRISSQAQLTPTTRIGQTRSNWLSQMIPLPEAVAVAVKAGQTYGISIAYNAGAPPEEITLQVTPLR